MTYFFLKFIHILTASLLIGLLIKSCRYWLRTHTEPAGHRHLMKNSMIVIPILILQLFTGFTLISIKHYDYKQLWVQGSTIGFMIMLSAWFVFVFCALKSKFKTIQFSMLIVTFLSLLSMIYLMANRI